MPAGKLSESRRFQKTEEPGFEIVTVRSGARTLRSRGSGETFHPVLGPLGEARELHLRQQHLLQRASLAPGRFVIWDVGLGAAANAIAVLDLFRDFRGSAGVELHSFDQTLAPLRFALDHADELGYLDSCSGLLEALPDSAQSAGPVRWQLHLGDFCELVRPGPTTALVDLPAPHAILYDPYSLVSNRAMWMLEHFTNLRACCAPDRPCLLTNYTRSTAARVTLLLAGFFVGHGVPVADKSETTVAATHLELLDSPLDHRWLKRVRRSSEAAPLRGSGGADGAISPADYDALTRHPQFSADRIYRS
jgi:hypothetical protein